MSLTYSEANRLIESARSESNGKPLQNNTRLYRRGDAFAVKLHAVDVVTINADDTYTLRNGGWATITTLDRIRTYAPVNRTLFSERGDWYLRLEPNADDPQPMTVNRNIPKPFFADDPGPEPVKNDEGCIAGQLVTTEHVNEVVEVWRKDMQDGDEFIEVVSESGIGGGDDYDMVSVKRSWNSHVWVGEGAQSYDDEGWREFTGRSSYYGGSTHTINGDEVVKYVQCSHCAEFDARHENWYVKMHGARWGSRHIDQNNGYETYARMMAVYGTVEAWQDAYITDFRARRNYLAELREWNQRNRVPFYDGVTVDMDGYAPRIRKDGPSPAKLRRHEREVAKIKKSIDKYVKGYIAALKEGMPMPSGGDCWYCAMFGNEGGVGHLFGHIEESYYVPSLAVNALRERGMTDVGVYITLGMDQDTNTMGLKRPHLDSVKRDLTKYMRKHMLPAAPTE